MPSVRDLYRKQTTELANASLEPLALPHIATPSDPGAGNTAIYAKTDGKLYTFPAGGAETEVGSASGGGHVIEDEGTPLTQRTNLNFVGSTVAVTDDAGNDRTIVTITSSGSGGGVSLSDIWLYGGF